MGSGGGATVPGRGGADVKVVIQEDSSELPGARSPDTKGGIMSELPVLLFQRDLGSF